MSEAEINALEAFKLPEESSLGQIALRLLRGVLGVESESTVNTIVNAVNADAIKERLDQLEQQLAGAIASREQLEEAVNAIVDKRIQHPLDILNDHQTRLLKLEQREAVPVRSAEAVNDTVNERIQDSSAQTDTQPEATVDDALPTSTEEEEAGAIASPTIPNPTDKNADSAPALLPKEKIQQHAETIQRAMTTNKNFKKDYGVENFKVELPLIKQKIIEMYSYADDWRSGDTKKEVIKALIKQYHPSKNNK